MSVGTVSSVGQRSSTCEDEHAPAHAVFSVNLCTVLGIRLLKGLLECFMNVQQAVSLICICHAARARNGRQGELKEKINKTRKNLTPQTVSEIKF